MKLTRLRRAIAPTLVGVVTALAATSAPAQTNLLVTGKRISLPPLGIQQPVASLPMNLILSPDERYAISSDMGYRQALWSIDARTGRGVSHIDFKRSGSEGLYHGLAAQKLGAETLVYASQGAQSAVMVASLGADGSLTQRQTIKLRQGDLAAGISLDRRGYLYVAINTFSVGSNDIRVMTTPGSLAILDTRTGMELGRYRFGTRLSNFPYAVEVAQDGSRAYVTSQRDGTVTVLDTTNPATVKQLSVIPTGAHPVAIRLNRAQTRLYVANAHSDTISIVDTASGRVAAAIPVRPQQLGRAIGATPTGLCLSPDENTLYVTLGDLNAVAVVSLPRNAVAGYVPTGWYPTAVAATRAGKLMWTNAKGTSTRNQNGKPSGPNGAWGTYSLSVLEGSVATLEAPLPAALPDLTRQVLANNGRATAGAEAGPLAAIGLKAGKIRHIIYVIKENRTYDQVLGDLTDAAGHRVGNGDPSLTLFGARITPNQHALALRFVTLDNFYDCGEVSGDGWTWSTQGMASEYAIKNVPYSYSGRGRKYDFEGQNNGYPVGGFPATDPDGAPMVGPLSPLFPSAPQIPDVSEAPGGHIWDNVLRAGLTIRNYGFFLGSGLKLGQTVMLPDNYPAVKPLQPAGHDLEGQTDYDFRKFDLSYADSEAPQLYFDRRTQAGAANAGDALYPMRTYGKHNAPSRFSEWNNEFQQMLRKDPSGAAVPNLMMLRLMQDHTQGVKLGGHTPDSEVADNDYAVGQLVEAVSKSPVWESTAIFVIEDDAQDGHDHVDCHRSTCYVISPYVRANSVDHTFYNTDSVLRTMEMLLGLPPMTQYDAVAAPIAVWDRAPSNGAAYSAILPAEEIITKLARADAGTSRLAANSGKLDFSHADSADPALLNAVLWKYAKGPNSTPPAPRHAVKAPAPMAGTRKGGKAGGTPARRPMRRDDDD